MTPVLVDSNVLIDVASGDPVWAAWSADALDRAMDEAVVVINPVIYGELAAGFPTVEALDFGPARGSLQARGHPVPGGLPCRPVLP